MIQTLAALLALVGFAALALSMKRHQRDMAGRNLSDKERNLTRAAGTLSIAASLALGMVCFGPAYGAIVWFGHLSIAAWIVVATLCWRARLSRRDRMRRLPIAIKSSPQDKQTSTITKLGK